MKGKKQSTSAYLWKNRKALGAYPLRDKSRTELALLNHRIARIPDSDPIKEQRIEEYDALMALHHAGKWLSTRAMEGEKKLWPRAYASFKTAVRWAKKLRVLVETRSDEALGLPAQTCEYLHEIEFVDGVPMVPDITPVVVLEGSSEQMGAQYARQIVDIFGPWILETKAGITKKTEAFDRWVDEHQRHTPELLEFCRGWADAAAEMGINQSYDDVLTLWVGHKAPATSYLNARGGMPELPPLACSAIAAWGKATHNGELVAGSTGDHDMSYQVVIAAYPDDGIPFVFTTFEATGSLPTVGPNWFFGHPGMNAEGLVYVHHGGGPKMLEPPETWGYGVRRGASVMHMLRYTSSAEDALSQENNWPIGDVGNGDQATVGGFYADPSGAYIVEGRESPAITRRAGTLGETDYLFANNSVAHPDAIESTWMSKIRDEWQWDSDGGWRPKKPKGMKKDFKMLLDFARGKLDTDMLMSRGMMFAYWNSYHRNRFFNRFAKERLGKMDVETLEELYRTGGSLPAGPWENAVKAYKSEGVWGNISPAHSSNCFVAIMDPGRKLFRFCTGPAKRGLAPMSPDQAISVRGERNAFWDLILAPNPEAMLEKAKRTAAELTEHAMGAARTQVPAGYGRTFKRLESELTDLVETSSRAKDADSVDDIARTLRTQLRIQVVARQILSLAKEG